MADEKKLTQLFATLSPQDRESVLAFAEFLHERAPKGESVPPEPLPVPEPIPRPDEETVIAAIKRLSQSYHMVDKREVLHQSSALMAAHMLQGKAAIEVIDELEAVFERSYRKLVEHGAKPR